MDQEYIYFLIILAYLTGAFPSAVLIGKIFFKTDVREFGSGNAGATNTFRVLGKKAGIPVLILDIFKGWLVVKYVFLINPPSQNIDLEFEHQLVFGIAAVIGHLFPIYTGFRGGKGIATLLGILIGIQPYAALLSFIVFLFVFIFSRYISLASIISSITFPIIIYFLSDSSDVSLIIFSIFVPLLALITHQKNIERLLRGEEIKVKFK
ncbi:MAG: glycerol-3-phosphate 1-O-acyltransferase PlsY [Flavobacteriales bacterium]|nr:glycerol-3-phosphate 1-O-acyltransferase PlsY [Flavobacteriales bacterium]